VPARPGRSVGSGEVDAIGSENCSRIGVSPLTFAEWSAGVTEVTCSGPAASSVTRLECEGLAAVFGWADA
jgi:hypothetical protein